ncbi:MAG: Asp-tRNA(Asn)/Glu-tRNA(Gln) amidotransferase subunit GatA [Abditibacteriota bacterium]|nr:Asp-tRNA(Asn)/Glu-tRNA(Gln) amidotransferase subunit GatA [Abditibacteriota bacterium]
MELYELTAHELAELIRTRKASAAEIARSFAGRIAEKEDAVKAYITVTEDKMLQAAEETDRLAAAGELLPPLAGVPCAVKDNMSTAGVRTTAASRILENYVPVYNATAVEKLEENLIPMTGKANLDEFAMGSSCENSAFFPTRNPWDLSRVPGGSSGGSAAAVAADECAFALGSDTGGSIRQPASFCGIVGVKPTYGRVSRYGLLAFASSLDQIGPMTKDVEDAALALNVICGRDVMDSTSLSAEAPDFTKALTTEIKGMKIAVPREFMEKGIAEDTKGAVLAAMKHYEELGAVVEYVSMPNVGYGLPVYYIIAPAECSSNLARYDGVKYGHRSPLSRDTFSMYKKSRTEGFGPEVKQRIMIGTYALSAGYYDAYYLKAQKVRTLVKNDFEKIFSEYDVIISPTAPDTAFGIGEQTDDPYTMKLADICTIPANLAGIPAMSLPCGFDGKGLPIGLQIMAPALGEEVMLRAAYAFEQTSDFRKKPAFPGGNK